MSEAQPAEDNRDAAVHEAVRLAWQRVTEQWDDAPRHDLLLGLVAQHNCFAWAAARYKERASDAITDTQLARLRRAATATMLASATARPKAEEQPYRKTILIFGLLVIALLLGLFFAKVVTSSDQPVGRVTKPARP